MEYLVFFVLVRNYFFVRLKFTQMWYKHLCKFICRFITGNKLPVFKYLQLITSLKINGCFNSLECSKYVFTAFYSMRIFMIIIHIISTLNIYIICLKKKNS